MIGTIIGAVLGIGSAVISGVQQQAAADAANEENKKRADAQYERSLKEWEISYLEEKANWAWQVAQTEAYRYAERQKEADYNWRADKLIGSAMVNMAINNDALRDRYVLEEDLRAKQVGMDLGYKMSQLASSSHEAIRQYMTGIRDTALQSMQLVNETERRGQELVSSMVFEQQKDYLQWEISQIATVIDQSQIAATAGTRMGGSASAERLALNAAQKLGRAWGEMDLLSRDRAARLGLLNSSMQGETANQMGRMALSMQDQAEKIKYTSDRYAADTAYELAVFKDLTIPSFKLATRQGVRDAQSLQIQTQSVIDEASMPFRKSITFDPIEPIKGLKPEYYAPTKVYSPSTAGIIGNAILGGVQGAIDLGTYTKKDGSLGWR